MSKLNACKARILLLVCDGTWDVELLQYRHLLLHPLCSARYAGGARERNLNQARPCEYIVVVNACLLQLAQFRDEAEASGKLLPARHPVSRSVRDVGLRIAAVAQEDMDGKPIQHMKVRQVFIPGLSRMNGPLSECLSASLYEQSSCGRSAAMCPDYQVILFPLMYTVLHALSPMCCLL